eukprot:CAMPEP_0174755264 /NCGR_PEP_ID=MMETSP1094-20130205/106159_1 /TAXON_ID=156173 /ORGANISM="Chrysochromulina brevifilum, Strain UTEX LB 985" /LENGTH=85 /DNA_ID=CAMNT_0015961151 /DNA_START=590 /DNA_END=848 /DNA_ORIENTATION=-
MCAARICCVDKRGRAQCSLALRDAVRKVNVTADDQSRTQALHEPEQLGAALLSVHVALHWPMCNEHVHAFVGDVLMFGLREPMGQ